MNRARRKLAIAEQMNLILASMVWAKLIEPASMRTLVLVNAVGCRNVGMPLCAFHDGDPFDQIVVVRNVSAKVTRLAVWPLK